MRLFDLAALLDDEVERVVCRAFAFGVLHFDGDVVADRTALCRGDAIRQLLVTTSGEFAASRRDCTRAFRTDADDVRDTAAVVEVPVHRMSEVRAFDEVAEVRDELSPVRDERRRVERALGREPDKGGVRGANTLNRASAAVELFNVDAGGQVLRHARPPLPGMVL